MAEREKMELEDKPRKKRCFVITPIGAANTPQRRHADWVYNFAVQPAFSAAGYEVDRADLVDDPVMINDVVFGLLTEAEVCVADLTFLNPNVFYELGVRHALGRPVIHIAEERTVIPFDNAGYKAILFDREDYASMIRLREGLARHIETIEKPGFVASNPLTHARGRLQMALSSDSRDQMFADMSEQMSMMQRQVDMLNYLIAGGSVTSTPSVSHIVPANISFQVSDAHIRPRYRWAKILDAIRDHLDSRLVSEFPANLLAKMVSEFDLSEIEKAQLARRISDMDGLKNRSDLVLSLL